MLSKVKKINKRSNANKTSEHYMLPICSRFSLFSFCKYRLHFVLFVQMNPNPFREEKANATATTINNQKRTYENINTWCDCTNTNIMLNGINTSWNLTNIRPLLYDHNNNHQWGNETKKNHAKAKRFQCAIIGFITVNQWRSQGGSGWNRNK